MLYLAVRKGMPMLIAILVILTGFVGLEVDNSSAETVKASTTRIVDWNGTGQFTTIQSAIDNSTDGDTVRVYDGMYKESVNVWKKIKLVGNGTGRTIISPPKSFDGVTIRINSVQVTGFTINGSGAGSSPTLAAGIYITGGGTLLDGVKVYGNEIYDFDHGIWFRSGKNCDIYKNDAHNNTYGIYLYIITNDNIHNNTCTNNTYGMYITSSDTLTISDNICNYNTITGIWNVQSYSMTIRNNQCSFNSYIGLHINNTHYCTIIDNTCNSNEIGIGVGVTNFWANTAGSNHNHLYRNTCSKNTYIGIYIFKLSLYNRIEANFVSLNKYGMYQLYSDYNFFVENVISYNDIGLSLNYPFHENVIIHNYFLSNTRQAEDNNPIVDNYWYSMELGGNYWDDYMGVDNGEGGYKYRYKGDGLGDTKLPHWKLDMYPFIIPGGWIYPGEPMLKEPGNISLTGNYTIDWPSTARTDKYVLEEASSAEFSDAEVIYEDGISGITFINKSLGTYYYRVKSIKGIHESPWSNIVNITVDYPPVSPVELMVILQEGHDVNLAWTSHPEPDIKGYHIMISDLDAGPTGPFELLDTVPPTITTYKATNLVEEKTYYFKVIAFDGVPSDSPHSNVVSTTIPDITAPSPPGDLKIIVVSGTEVNLTWKANRERDLEGYLVYINHTGEGPEGKFKPILELDPDVNYCNITELEEEVTYHFKVKAYDEVPNYSLFSSVVAGTTPDETPPHAPAGLTISDITNVSMKISWEAAPDKDVAGYILYRSYYSSDLFFPLNTKPINDTVYFDTGLFEYTKYYYKIMTVDDDGLLSGFTNTVMGMTAYHQYPPRIGISIGVLEMEEDEVDDHSVNLLDWFYDINNDPLSFRCEGNVNINVTINASDGRVILAPEYDWSGRQRLTFYASDGYFPEISDTLLVIVNPVNDPPESIDITTLSEGMEFENDESLELEAICFDPDIDYGDVLTFKWFSNVTGELGEGENLSSITLLPGSHLITLYVMDEDGLMQKATVNITINDVPVVAEKSPEKSDNRALLVLISIIVSIIALIMVAVLIFHYHRKRKRAEAEEEREKEKKKEEEADPKAAALRKKKIPEPIELKKLPPGKVKAEEKKKKEKPSRRVKEKDVEEEEEEEDEEEEEEIDDELELEDDREIDWEED
ncbi:MAG: fibronectin type III domain-containing protein [Thermoplasmata archaeon]|nr:MAG: fibronectin type III domain-containing protein [Thermoplasmata archaeon]